MATRNKRIKISCRGAASLPIGELVAFQGELKTLSPENGAKLKKEIRQLGFSEPVSVWKHRGEHLILNGHQRLAALLELQAEGYQVPPIPVNYITARNSNEAKRKVLALTSSYGTMDAAGLNDFIEGSDIELQEVLDSFAFPEIDEQLQRTINNIEKQGKVDDDAVPDPPAKARTKLGDLYQLGPHRLLCGDATDPIAVARLMDGAQADMVFTDPPYNVDYSGRGETTKGAKILNDAMHPSEFYDFLKNAFTNFKTAAKGGAPFYVCHPDRNQHIFERAMESTGLLVKCLIIWNKAVASMGWSDYRSKHEPIFYASYGRHNVKFYGDRRSYTVWNESWSLKKIEQRLRAIAKREEKGGSTVWTLSREHTYLHPTQKPVELVGLALKNSSKRDDIILDLFAGSGTTIIASEKAERVAYCMELDPRYCDVITQRWAAFTEQGIIKPARKGAKGNGKTRRKAGVGQL